MALGTFLVRIRDRVVRRSQIGKEKLDAAFARRELDQRLQDLGERYHVLVAPGVTGVPEDLRALLAEVDALAAKWQQLREHLRHLEEDAAHGRTT